MYVGTPYGLLPTPKPNPKNVYINVYIDKI